MIDTHCHLSLTDNIDLVINNMNGNIIIISGVDDATNREVIEICNKYKNIYGTIGYHPEEVCSFNDKSLSFIENNLNNPKIVGIGEIGLDYHYCSDNKELQKEIFIKQLELAKKYNKCVVVHSRDAIQDTYNILKKYDMLKINLHCYSGSYEMAIEFTKLGVKLGIGGVITFKNANKLVEVVKNIDMKYLLLETDSPYLAPVPYRGQKNEPSNILLVAQKIAQIKNISVDDVLKITTENAICQFDLDILK